MILLRIFFISCFLKITYQFSFIEKAEFVGCFRDSNAAPDFRISVFFHRNNNPNICFDECFNKGYFYAATQFGHEIFTLVKL